MAVADRINGIIEPTITQQGLIDSLKTAFEFAIGSSLDEFDSGTDKVLIYALFRGFGEAYAISYLKVRVTNALVIGCQLLGVWNVDNHTGGFASTEVVNSAFSSSVAINFTALSQDELVLILLQQGSLFVPLGCLGPELKPDWWSLDSFNYSFMPVNNTFTLWRTTAKQPFTGTDHDSFIGSSRLAGANPITNKRDILQGICLFSTSNQGISGRTSDDLVIVAASGSARYDIIRTPDNREYLILNPAAGGFAVRIA